MQAQAKDKVVIVEAMSTGFNLIQDCLDRGLEPVILEVLYGDEESLKMIEAERETKYRKLKAPVLTLRQKDDYEETLAMIRALNPRLVIPGAEDGVVLATRLADDLGLPGNPFSIIDKMTDKFHMHQALADAGLRHIRGKVFDSAEEAAAYYDELGLKKVVVKPPHGAGSMGVRFCDSREEVIERFTEQAQTANLFGELHTSLLVQERIIGEEYIVNTVTVDGQHRLVSMLKYEKKALPNGSNIYVGMKFLPTMTPETYEMVKYAFAVLDAIGIKQGPVHGEYMLDENGPVLMEINCRCMGASLPAAYGDRVMGHHETDMALDAYINPKRVLAATEGIYRTKAYGIEKFLRAPEDTTIMSTPLIGILPYLRSFHTSALLTTATRHDMPKTVDLETSPGCIYMVHEDEGVLKQEYELLCELETNYFGLLYQKSYDPSLGALTYVTGEENELASFTMSQTQLKDYPLEDVYQYLKDIIRIVKPGGSIVVPKMVYDDFPYGAAGLIMIMKVMNCAVMRPTYGSDDMVFVNGKQA